MQKGSGGGGVSLDFMVFEFDILSTTLRLILRRIVSWIWEQQMRFLFCHFSFSWGKADKKVLQKYWRCLFLSATSDCGKFCCWFQLVSQAVWWGLWSLGSRRPWVVLCVCTWHTADMLWALIYPFVGGDINIYLRWSLWGADRYIGKFLAQSRYGINIRYFIIFTITAATTAITPTEKVVVAWVAGSILPTSSPHSPELISCLYFLGG